MAIGSDQGGSVRVPAAWCGIAGLKPTCGLVPYTGAISVDGPVDYLGPMARTVTDCAKLLKVIQQLVIDACHKLLLVSVSKLIVIGQLFAGDCRL